jgi:hypothetical protein
VKHAPGRADFVGANRDEVAFADGKTDIYLQSFSWWENIRVRVWGLWADKVREMSRTNPGSIREQA